MSHEYDFVIFGGGPSGLTIAQICKRFHKSFIIIEKENELGGCHRVERVDDLFSEHGPRVYINNFKTFDHILKDIGTSLNTLFHDPPDYNMNLKTHGNMSPDKLKLHEVWGLLGAFFYHCFLRLFRLFREDKHAFYSHHISMEQFMDQHSFSKESRWFIDTICRLTDGGGSDKYSLFQFMELFDMSAFKKVMQPRLPNDHPEGLIGKWTRHLVGDKSESENKIISGWKLQDIVTENDRVQYCVIQETHGNRKDAIVGKNYILAMPPESFIHILDKKSNDDALQNAFGKLDTFREWSQDTRYDEYLCFTVHWYEEDAEIVEQIEKNRRSMPRTDWGLVHMNMMFFEPETESESESEKATMRKKTILSCSITKTQEKSSHINKTANECMTVDEWLDEAVRQLMEASHFPEPSYKVAFSGVERKSNKWVNTTTAFFSASKHKSIPFESETLSNLYNVGCQNGHHKYHLTTIEAAISNAIALMHKLHPPSRNVYKIYGTGLRISHMIYMIAIFMAFMLYYFFVHLFT